MEELYQSLHYKGNDINWNIVLRYTESLREIDEFEEEYDEKYKEIQDFVFKLFEDQTYFNEDGEVLDTYSSVYRKFMINMKIFSI